MKPIELTTQEYILVLHSLQLSEMFWKERTKEARAGNNSAEIGLCRAEAEAYRELQCTLTENRQPAAGRMPSMEMPTAVVEEKSVPQTVEWGSRKDAAAIVRISLPTLHALINQGIIISRKIGRRTLINLTDLREKLANGEVCKYKRAEK